MKKYVKPAISFQFFNLTTEVSGGCIYSSSNQSDLLCPIEIPGRPGETVFTDYNTCFMTPEDGGLCVQVPTADNRVLGS